MKINTFFLQLFENEDQKIFEVNITFEKYSRTALKRRRRFLQPINEIKILRYTHLGILYVSMARDSNSEISQNPPCIEISLNLYSKL